MESFLRLILTIEIFFMFFYFIKIMSDDIKSKFLNFENKYLYSGLSLLILNCLYLSHGDLIFNNIVKYNVVFQYELINTFYVYSFSSFILRKYQFTNNMQVNNFFSLFLAAFQYITIAIFCFSQSSLTEVLYVSNLSEWSIKLLKFFIESSVGNKIWIMLVKLLPLFIMYILWYKSLSRKVKDNKKFESITSKILIPFLFGEFNLIVFSGFLFERKLTFLFILIIIFFTRILYVRNIGILFNKSIKDKKEYLRIL